MVEADWIIFYDTASPFDSFSSLDGPPEDAPRDGAMVVVVRDSDVGRRLLWNQDAYCWEDGTWVPHDWLNVERYRKITKWPIWINGYWRDNDLFWRVHKEAREDVRLPPKQGLKHFEQDSYSEWGRYGNDRG